MEKPRPGGGQPPPKKAPGPAGAKPAGKQPPVKKPAAAPEATQDFQEKPARDEEATALDYLGLGDDDASSDEQDEEKATEFESQGATQDFDARKEKEEKEVTAVAKPQPPSRPAPPGGKGQGAGGDKPEAKGQAAPEKQLTVLGDFRLSKKLGNGGMGSVYKAHQISLDREVALKVLFKHLADNQTFVQRFYREARVQAKLDHPNIVRGYWVGEEKGLHMFAMEFIDGGSMQSWLKQLGKLSVGDALHVALAVAYALQHAHELDMIHRDIKPDNILVTRKGVVKVADLGLAKALHDDMALTQSGVGAGTPYYMAPEQAHSAKHVDARADIYALGTMLYVFLTGQMPFKGETTVEIIKAKEEGKFPPVRRSNPEVPERLDLMIDKMLAKVPEHRYQTCAEIIKDLEGLDLAGERLSFIPEEEAAPSKPAGFMPSKKTPAKGLGGPAKPAALPPESEPAPEDWWYIQFPGPGGKKVTKKMSQQQVEELIKNDNFDLSMQASRDFKTGFKTIGTYKEFEYALRGRLAKAKATRKAAKYTGMMEQIVQEDARRRRWAWVWKLFGKVKTLVGFLIILGVAIALIALLIHFFADVKEWFSGFMNKLGFSGE